MASRSSITPILDEVVVRLKGAGFRKRAGYTFTRDIAEDMIGKVGLNYGTSHHGPGEITLNPIVGIRHQEIERVVAELRGVTFHPYNAATVLTTLSLLVPHRVGHWFMGPENAAEVAEEVVAAVLAYGLPFMESGAGLEAVCRLMDQNNGYPHQLDYTRPVGWWLAGEKSRAVSLVEQMEADLAGRDDPRDLSTEPLRAYCAAFHERFGI